ncbi:MAG: dockerin type I repeat-containing protein [Clostridia bacterium]|nr:dockerin type I repeat-containing protein [Clostridia bacterium]
MKKIIAVILAVLMLFTTAVTVFANYREPVDGIKMVSGLNPVVKLIDGNKFEYIIYARDMEKLTNGDFTVSYAENLSLVSFEETGNHDMCFYNDADNTVKISFMYNESNQETTLKMFVLTFEYTDKAVYPSLKVTNIAGTYIKSVAEVVVLDEREETPAVSTIKGDVDLNGKITAADARLALRKSAKIQTLSSEQMKNADVNGDGVVSATDARLILRYTAGLIKEF